ncbi:respiratory nitrate reductase subunit gamma [Roseobacter sp. HKCCD6490]|uniref:respiratory nitrate reductase subunit gamma n=1 Tax=Roseobacter sp. HKCCD6490 TaxID=2690594 RepID=UPI00155769B4|nr:respiratory nitrate reductase subunit gamma [Roseobacter sp. HKCCD6490]NPU05153.1 respiratory nitrate reductase subunit gamma [Roseobacter sp. HKCCD6490]
MFSNFSLDFIIFGVMPYVALTVLLVGTIARYERDPYTWKSSSSQLLRRKQLILGSVLFHVGILTVFFGHLLGLFTPVWVLDALGIPYALKQWLAVVVGGIAGIVALIGATMLMHRRLTDPRIRATSSFADIGILGLIWLQLLIGLLTITQTMQHMDGAEMVRFMTWSQSVVTWNLNAWLMVVDVHWLYKIHIFLGLLITMLFPFTRLVHMISAPISYLWRPGYQVVRSRRQTSLPARSAKPQTPAE